MFIFTIQEFMNYLKKNFLYGLVLLFSAVYCFIEAEGLGDFYIYMSAAGSLDGVTNIFTKAYLADYNYFYSVLFAAFLKLFYPLPYFWVKYGWLLLNIFLYFKLFRLLADSNLLNNLSVKQKNIFLFLVFIFSFRFLHDNIHTSQVSIIILACCIYGMYYVRKDKIITGSLLLAIGINIKLLPIVFLPYLFYKGYFKAFGFTLLFYLLSLIGPSVFIGHSYNITLLKSWLVLVNPSQQRHVLDVDERSFHGLSTLLSTLLIKNVPDIHALTLKRNIADLSVETLSKTLLVVRLTLVALTLYLMKWMPFVKSNLRNSLIEVSYVFLLIPLIFPHQQHYAFIFIVPAFALVLYTLILNFEKTILFKKRTIIFLLVLIYLFGNLKIVFGEYNVYYEHFKILTYGALLLVPLLFWVSAETNKIRLTDSLK